MAYFAVICGYTMTDRSRRGVLRILDERGTAEATAVAATLEVHPVTVAQTCRDLQAEGHVRQVSQGVFTITEDGRALARAMETQ